MSMLEKVHGNGVLISLLVKNLKSMQMYGLHECMLWKIYIIKTLQKLSYENISLHSTSKGFLSTPVFIIQQM